MFFIDPPGQLHLNIPPRKFLRLTVIWVFCIRECHYHLQSMTRTKCWQASSPGYMSGRILIQ